jgi:hypothetical protein
MTRGFWFVVVLTLSCSPEAGALAVWNLGDFGQSNKDFGGFDSSLWVEKIDTVKFPHLASNTERGVTVFPATENGKSIALVITEIWKNWPTPWVQPVYRSGDAVFFGIGRQSTFYSPFWSLVVMPPKYASVESVVRAPSADKVDQVNAVYCPITVGALQQLASSVVPLTQVPLNAVPRVNRAQVLGEAETQSYFDFGADRFERLKNLPVESPLYVFVDSKRRPLPVPFVVPADAARKSFWRRVEVVVPETAAILVAKPLFDSLRAQVDSVMIFEQPSETSPLAVRIVRDKACLSQSVPACEFLDSETAIVKLPQSSRLSTGTTLAAAKVGGL